MKASASFFTHTLFKSNFHRDIYLSGLLKKFKIKNGCELFNFITTADDNTEIPTFAKKINTRNYNRDSTLLSIDGPLQLLHADIADLRFMKPSASEAKYLLVIVDLFSSYIYAYAMKKRTNLMGKLNMFYKDVEESRQDKDDEVMRIQTDLEFSTQTAIKKINEINNVQMFMSRTNRGHAFATEQKIREIKKLLVKLRRNFSSKKVNNYKLVKLAVENLNKKPTVKYAPAIPKKVQELTTTNKDVNKENRNMYNAFRLDKVTKAIKRYNQSDLKWNKKINYQPINVGDRVLVAAYRLLKSSDPGVLDKKTTDKKSYYNRKKIFEVVKKYRSSSQTYYRVKNVQTNQILKGQRFTRNELFKL